MKWRFFIWACALIGYGMFRAGAPPLTILAGIAFATLINSMSGAKISWHSNKTAQGQQIHEKN